MMTFDEYQKQALTTVKHGQNQHHDLMHFLLGLSGETGEVLDKAKKVFRDHDGKFSEEKKQEIASEVGDVLWYIAVLTEVLGFSLEEIAAENAEKLASRKKRGKIGGSGDQR